LWRHSATIQWATASRSSTLSTAKHHHTWEAPGLQAVPSNRDGVRHLAEDAEKKEQKPQQGRARPDRAARGQAQLGNERRRRRRAETKATNGGKADRSPWSEERARGGGANAPHGDGGDHRSSPESSSEAIGDSQSPERVRD
jgi:hypothetical protein